MAPTPPILLYVHAQEKVRTLQCEAIPEPGCPITVSQARTELDLDPFGAPLAARIYIDYANSSQQEVAAVKFRIRFVDPQGNDRGTFHAPDAFLAPPGAVRSQKWKYERVDPRITDLKIRVLQVRFADGSSWQSAKMQELANPPGSTGSSTGPQDGAGSDKAPTATP